MKMSPRYREATAFVRTRHQPPHIKYPLIGFHVVANVNIYDADRVNAKETVSFHSGFSRFWKLSKNKIWVPVCVCARTQYIH